MLRAAIGPFQFFDIFFSFLGSVFSQGPYALRMRNARAYGLLLFEFCDEFVDCGFCVPVNHAGVRPEE